jgi:cellulose synthase/poly-beta-1,6-N-acetylglucosamine synthase-like glycosyltransferase
MTVQIVLCLMALITLVPVSVLFLQVLMALPKYRSREISGGQRPAVAVMIPAHNEALLIADTLHSITSQLNAGDRLLVVADNCTDDTAEIAAAANAEVIERKDEHRRGKDYAMDFGIRHLERDPPEVIIIVDADCQVGAETINCLAQLCGETARPAQSMYLMQTPRDGDLQTRIAEFAWLVKNLVRRLGYHRLGLPCQLMGTGMAFPWSAISTTPLASGHLAEDLLLGIRLTRSGTPPLFCPEALVTSNFPETLEGIASQRKRWEHGHLGVIVGEAPRLFVEAITRGSVDLMALALDLCVPPLALLMILTFGVFAASAVFAAAVPTGTLPMWLAAVALAMLTSAILLSWGRYARRIIPLRGLVYVPFYALAKIPLYFKFLTQRQVDWVRSRRGKN